ncbi:MAG TPA: sulfotransferase [Bacteroidia bacterium]|nr:sulfotransferase [Bacteroidia bacterium]
MIIIAGNSRSGTTMTGRILGNHPAVFTFQELHFFDELSSHSKLFENCDHRLLVTLYAKLLARQRNGYFGNNATRPFMDEAEKMIVLHNCKNLSEVYKTFLTEESKRFDKSIPCEQTPQNLFALDALFKIFPDAKVVLMVRDPREVLLSQKNKWKRRTFTSEKFPLSESIRAALNYHPVTISKIWHASANAIIKHSRDKRILVVRFEDLIGDADKTIRAICSHCRLEFNANMLKIPFAGSSNVNDAPGTLGIDSSRTGKWENGLSKTEIAICQKINGPLMTQWGYDQAATGTTFLWLTLYYISMPVKLILSLPFNIKRLKNPGRIWRSLTGN